MSYGKHIFNLNKSKERKKRRKERKRTKQLKVNQFTIILSKYRMNSRVMANEKPKVMVNERPRVMDLEYVISFEIGGTPHLLDCLCTST